MKEIFKFLLLETFLNQFICVIWPAVLHEVLLYSGPENTEAPFFIACLVIFVTFLALWVFDKVNYERQ